jgi:hypothetical protein
MARRGHDLVDVRKIERSSMSRLIIALFFLLAAQQANAAECGSTANQEGCVGPNGAASYNKNSGEVHAVQPYHSNQVAPGAQATKAMEPGCTFVNGKQVCKQRVAKRPLSQPRPP